MTVPSNYGCENASPWGGTKPHVFRDYLQYKPIVSNIFMENRLFWKYIDQRFFFEAVLETPVLGTLKNSLCVGTVLWCVENLKLFKVALCVDPVV